MSAVTSELWQRLAGYEIGPARAVLSFTRRLARDNGWSEAFAARVVTEYKRFCYLAVTTGQEVTPSDAVDQAWHLHLAYTRDYWNRFCPEALGTPLHHGPTTASTEDRTRFYHQYAETLRAYEEAFGKPPPPDIWPNARRRFVVDPKARRVNPADVIILSRIWRIILPIAGGLLFVTGLLLGGML